MADYLGINGYGCTTIITVHSWADEEEAEEHSANMVPTESTIRGVVVVRWADEGKTTRGRISYSGKVQLQEERVFNGNE